MDRTIDGLRRIVGRLSPQALEKLGLAGAIRKEARSLEIDSGVKADVRIAENLGSLSSDAELALYRLVQEALHNVSKHANAKNVQVELARKEGKVRLVVQDDGVGLAKESRLSAPHLRNFGNEGAGAVSEWNLPHSLTPGPWDQD